LTVNIDDVHLVDGEKARLRAVKVSAQSARNRFAVLAAQNDNSFLTETAGSGRRRNGANRAKTSGSSKNFFGGTLWSSNGGENDERGVHRLEQNQLVYSVEGADAVIYSKSAGGFGLKFRGTDGKPM